MADLLGSQGQSVQEVRNIPVANPLAVVGAVPVNGQNNSVAAAAITATLAAAAGKTTFIQGFTVTGLGATVGGIIPITVTGLLGGTQTFYYAVPAGAAISASPFIVTFPVALPASAVNTAIVVNVPSLGIGNVAAGVNAWGYQA
jgi:hypothetical protein